MPKAMLLIRTDFDRMENEIGSARISTPVAVFMDESDVGGMGAAQKIGQWLVDNPVKTFEGWDGKIYPSFSVKDIAVL